MQLAQAEPLTVQVAQANRRRSSREEIHADTLMTDREGRLSGVRLLNVSEDGFMAITDMDQCEREPIRIDMPLAGWMRADIVWVLGERIGAQFREPLTSPQLRAIVVEATRQDATTQAFRNRRSGPDPAPGFSHEIVPGVGTDPDQDRTDEA